jgi:hypothetical protein
MPKVSYFPLLELLLFLVSFAILGAAFYLGFNIWLILSLLLVAYLMTLGNTYIIKLHGSELTFLSLSPFLSSHWISINAIIKLNSEESYVLESDATSENTYPIFKRKYFLEYSDKHDKKRTVYFSIHNELKAKRIFQVLKS